MKTRTLLDLTDELQCLLDQIEDAGGELDAELEERLAVTEDGLQAKLTAICALVRKSETTAAACKDEAARLTTRARVMEATGSRLKQLALFGLERLGFKSYDLGVYKTTVCKNSRPSIEWVGEGNPPPQWQRVEIKLNGQAVYDSWKSGITLPEGFLVTHGKHLRIT